MDLHNQKEFYNNYWSNPTAISNSKRIRITSIMQKLGDVCLENKNLKILDLGCGDGRSVAVWSLFGTTVGLELSPAAVQNANLLYPKYEIKEGNATSIPYPNNEFDVVVNQEVIEHIEDQELLIKECFRVLKQGGKLILTTPNKYYFDRRRGGNYSNQPIEKLIDMRTLSNLVNKQGFTLIQSESIIPKSGDFGVYYLLDKIFGRISFLRSITKKIKNKWVLSAHLIIVCRK